MRILLLGEYSGVHTNLSKALRNSGHEVNCIHDGDGYKKLNADIYIYYTRYSSSNIILNYMLNFYYKFLTILGVKGVFQILKYRKTILEMKGYDIVQLINPFFLSDFGFFTNIIVFRFLRKKNKKIFLSALGDDYFWIKYCLSKKYKYTMFDRLNISTLKYYFSQLQWVLNPLYIILNKYIVKRVNAVIPGLYDYYLPYKNLKNCSHIVPIIINLKNDNPIINISYPINIFHGWQIGKEYRKGSDIFDEVISLLKEKYINKINYEIVSGLPYSEYIKKFENSHIFIDQCFSYDCGVNGLLGLSAAKAVFSGMEKDVIEYYNLDYKPLINAVPNKDELYRAFEELILDPSLIKDYSINGIRFISEYHSANYVLTKYEQAWSSF